MKRENLILQLGAATALSALIGRSFEAAVASCFPLGSVLRTAATNNTLAELLGAAVQEFLVSLTPQSAYASLALRANSVDFEGNATVSVPYRSGQIGELSGAWVGENGAIPVQKGTLGSAMLNRYKLAAISSLTKELASTSRAAQIIEGFIAADIAAALDAHAFSSNAAVAGIRPAGLLAGIAALPASTATDLRERIAEDIGSLVNALVAAGCGTSRAVLAMNSASAVSLSLAYDLASFKIPVASSDHVPAGRIVLTDAANFVTGLGVPEFDASEAATLVMADADAVAPTHATDPADHTIVGTSGQVPAGGGLSVRAGDQQAAGKVGEASIAISAFQQYSIALRSVLPVSWAKCRAGSVQWVDGAGW